MTPVRSSLVFFSVFLATHPRIQSLRIPNTKMSKSAPNPNSKILLTDTATEIYTKIKSAITDSLPGVTYDPILRPGVSGLLQIYSGYSGENVHDIASRFNSSNRGMMEFKESCAEVVESSLKSFREEFSRIKVEEGYLKERELNGAKRAREVASQSMKEVRAVVGTD